MLQRLALLLFKLTGWTMVGEVPDIKKAVFIAAPHTSNWDGFWFLAYKLALDVEVRFLAKHTLFWWPLGSVLSAMGAMPVDRRHSSSVVEQLADAFEEEDRLFLALSPEGTRKRTKVWKTGFYQIAKAADVPIVMAYIDYQKKELGIGPQLPQGASLDEITPMIREFYAKRIGKNPDNQGSVQFRE